MLNKSEMFRHSAFGTLFFSLSVTLNLCPAQTCFLNGCGHGCACFLFLLLRLILHRFQMRAPTLLALKWTVMFLSQTNLHITLIKGRWCSQVSHTSNLFPNMKDLHFESPIAFPAPRLKGSVPSHHLVGDHSYAPPVYFLQQFELGATAAISHFNFFTHSHIFTRVSTNRKCVVWTVLFISCLQVYMEHSYAW
jgi:hypothetical protein